MTPSEQRQLRIAQLNVLIAHYELQSDDGCFHARGQADGYIRARDELVRGGEAVEQTD